MDFCGNATCTCGKEMNQKGGSFGGSLAVAWRTCDCGIQAAFYSAGDDREVTISSRSKDHRVLEQEKQDKLLNCFKMAGVQVRYFWNIKNEYYGDSADWLLVQTDFGLVKIGWRKRVIVIDWSNTGIEFTIDEDVTKDSHYCHAWGYPKAIEAIEKLKKSLNS